MAKKGREFEFQFNISAEMEQSFKQAMGVTEKGIKEIEKELRDIKSSNSFKTLEKEMKSAGKVAGSFENEMKGIGEIFGDVAKYAGSFALLTEGIGSIGDMATTVLQLNSSMSDIQSATGLTAKDMQDVEASAREIYAMGLGEGFVDISNKITIVKQNTKAVGDELEELTKQAMIFEDTFGEDVAESTRSADMLMKQYGITAKQAYNLMAQGMQGGLNKTNELLDTINEFTPQFKVLGYTAEEMFDFFGSGLDAGAWNLDKVGDLVKEFDNRLKDTGDANFQDALAQLFAPENIDEYAKALMKGSKATAEYKKIVELTDKATADTLVKNLKKGGKSGADSMIALASILGDSQKLLDGISSGDMRGADALNTIFTQLSKIEDPLEKQTLGIALMGTQYEDLGIKVVDSLAAVESRFDSTKATMEEIEAVKYDNLLHDFKELGRELMDSFVIPLGETLIPALEDLAEWGKDNKDLIKNMALLVPTVAAGKKMGQFATSIGSLAVASKGAGLGVKGLGLAAGLLGGPVGIGVTAIAGITMAVSAYQKKQEEARQELLHLGDSMEEAYGQYKEVVAHTDKVSDLISEYDQLTNTIKYSKQPTEELEEARARLAEVEQLLIDMNPDTLRAEDAKTDRFREQLGLVEDLNKHQREMADRELEIQYIDNQTKINALEEEYKQLQANNKLYDEQYTKALEQHEFWSKYNSEMEKIKTNSSWDLRQQYEEIEKLVQKLNTETGMNYTGSDIAFNASDAFENYKTYSDSWVKTNSEIATANESFEQIYEISKAYIEMGLGGSLEEYADKFNELSETEKGAFIEALWKIEELNNELDLLPDAKKIDVQVIYNDATGYGGVPDSVKKQYGLKGLDQYAEGGFANKASIFGEAGLEAAIPINNNPRSHDLLDKVNNIMGHSTGGDTIVLNATVNVSGASGNVKQEVMEGIRMTLPEFERMMDEYLRQQKRRKL